MPKRSTENTGAVDHEELHPVGVAGDPEATNPHEADPTPNVETKANKRERVNAGILTDEFAVLGDRPADAIVRSAPQGRSLNDSTVKALQFLRANPGKYCKVGEWTKRSAPSDRLKWAGFFVKDGELVAPTEEQERRTGPNDFDVKRKIAYTYRPNTKGTFDLLLALTEEDYTPPKTRGSKAKDDVNTTTDEGNTDSVNPMMDGDDTPVDEETEPTEAIG